MAVAPALLFTRSPESYLDNLLMRICVALQLGDALHEAADGSYQQVAAYLESHPTVAPLRPAIHPQGSMRLGTTVMPCFGEEYDLDFVCELARDARAFAKPVDALRLIDAALRENPRYAPMLQTKNRCIRLKYARKFHLDVLPACKDAERGGTCILVPDRELSAWVPSNPRGYADWFDGRARQLLAPYAMDKEQKLPEPERAEEKSPLKLAVQLMKRNRDVRARGVARPQPVSIVLTTLAALSYRGERSVSGAMNSIIRNICEMIPPRSTRANRLVVLNPTNKNEDLSERWSRDGLAYQQFLDWAADFRSAWNALLALRGIDKVTRALETMFGEHIAHKALQSQAADFGEARERNAIGTTRGTGLIAAVGTGFVTPIPRHTFHGQKRQVR